MFDDLYKYLLTGFILFSVLYTALGREEIANGAGSELTADSLVSVNAQLRSFDDGTPVIYAHIFNPGLDIGTTSDTLGFFSIIMRRDDSLLITDIAFKKEYFSLPDFWPSDFYSGQIYLKKQVYRIEQVSIHSMPGYEQLKRETVSSIGPKTPEEKRIEYIQRATGEEAFKYNKIYVGFSFSMKTKEQKSLEKLQIILAEQRKMAQIRLKFNENNIGELTGLNGIELKNFMRHCNFSEEFLLNASEYDVLHRAKRIFRKYERSTRLQRYSPGT